MAASTAGRLAREINTLVGERGLASVPDAVVLERFALHHDEAAFEELVRRHGRLVFGVCRRVLRDPHAAEDVFQATFLVLAHKAKALDWTRPLASWLHTVAFRLANRARVNAARRRRHESAVSPPPPDDPPELDDTAVILHEELNRLPEKHRAPLVLAYLEGRTYEQVSRSLGCPVGSVGWRLQQAMQVLHDRLVHRGVVTPAAGVATLLAATGASAAAPLIDATVRGALWFAGESVGTAVASAAAVQLARGAVGTMTTHKLAMAASLLLVTGLGTVWLARTSARPDDSKPATKAIEATAKPADLPEGALARMGTAQFRHGEAVFFIAYTADGKRIVTAGRDHAVKMWDRASGKEVRSFERAAAKKLDIGVKVGAAMPGGAMVRRGGGPTDFPVALSPDGKTLAAGRDAVVTVWDVATGRAAAELTAAAGVFELAFTPDGKSIVTADTENEVAIWATTGGKPTKTFKVPAEAGGLIRTGVAVSPTGTHAVHQYIDGAAGNAAMRLTDLTTGKTGDDIKVGVGGAQCLTFSPDGKRLAWASFTDGVVVYDVQAGKPVTTFGRGEGHPRLFGNSIRFSDDGKTLAVATENDSIELWDVAASKLLRTIGGAEERGGPRRVAVRIVAGAGNRITRTDLAFSPDGKTLAASLGNATVRQFDTGTGTESAAAPGHLSGVLAVGGAGARAVSVSKESVRVWDTSAGREVRHWSLTPPAIAAVVSADAKLVATSSGGPTVTLWDAATGAKVRHIDTNRSAVAGLGLSPDGKTLATKTELNSAVNLWDATTGTHLRTVGQDGEPVLNGGKVTIETGGTQSPLVAFSPDGRQLAAAGDRKQLCVWDAATGALVFEVTTAAAAFGFSANGHVVAAVSGTGGASGFEVATGEKRYEFKPAADEVEPLSGLPGGGAMDLSTFTRGNAAGGGVAFSGDGRFVAAGAGGPAIRVWDTLTGQSAARLKGHQGSVSALRSSPDGRTFVSGSVDTTAVAWTYDTLTRVDLTRDMAPGEVEDLWAALAKSDAKAAFAAGRALLSDRDRAVVLLKERVRPVPVVEEARVSQLVADLCGTFDARRKATAELEKLGDQAADALRAALAKNPPLDVKQRVEKLLAKATVQKPTGDRLRELRAVELLELAATPDAKRVLQSLAEGAAGARLTREAKAAAGRVGK